MVAASVARGDGVAPRALSTATRARYGGGARAATGRRRCLTHAYHLNPAALADARARRWRAVARATTRPPRAVHLTEKEPDLTPASGVAAGADDDDQFCHVLPRHRGNRRILEQSSAGAPPSSGLRLTLARDALDRRRHDRRSQHRETVDRRRRRPRRFRSAAGGPRGDRRLMRRISRRRAVRNDVGPRRLEARLGIADESGGGPAPRRPLRRRRNMLGARQNPARRNGSADGAMVFLGRFPRALPKIARFAEDDVRGFCGFVALS